MTLSDPASLLGESLRLPDSLWAQTAIKGPKLASLACDANVDVVIVGAGYTGLSAAIQLAEAGLSCMVLDASEPGWGASGRNNGQVIAGLKLDPEVIERLYPGESGRRLVQFGSEAPSRVWELIKRYGIDCAANQGGWIQPAFTRSGFVAAQKRCEAWRERGIATQMLEGRELHRRLGTGKYSLGWLDPRGGSVQPLSYARGLANVASRLGVTLCSATKVEALMRRGKSWVAKAGGFEVSASHVIVATGAYAERLVPGLRTSFVPVRTAQVATRPLPYNMRNAILPSGHVSSDTRQLLTSFRLSPDGRLVMGGSGATAGLDHSVIVPCLQRAGEELFGHLGRLEWNFHWSGYFAVTTDHLPHVHEPASEMHIAVGCNGRGIAVSTYLGMQLAHRILGMSADQLSVPVSSMRTVKFHAFRGLGVKAATLYKRLQDRLE